MTLHLPRFTADPSYADQMEFVTLSDVATSLPFRGITSHQPHPLTYLRQWSLQADFAGTVDSLLCRLSEATANVTWRTQQETGSVMACQEFAALVARLAEVESVVCTTDGDITHVWTYLDGKPFETEPRHRVYDAEEEILRRHPRAPVEFHLVNLAEYPRERRQHLRVKGTPVLVRPIDA